MCFHECDRARVKPAARKSTRMVNSVVAAADGNTSRPRPSTSASTSARDVEPSTSHHSQSMPDSKPSVREQDGERRVDVQKVLQPPVKQMYAGFLAEAEVHGAHNLVHAVDPMPRCGC